MVSELQYITGEKTAKPEKTVGDYMSTFPSVKPVDIFYKWDHGVSASERSTPVDMFKVALG